MKNQNQKGKMSLVGHLTEIRNRLAVCLVALFLVFIACFAFIRPLAHRVLDMGNSLGFQYVYIEPSELLSSYFKLSLILAVVVVSPFLMFELWQFVSPALKPLEKRAVLPALFGGFIFFLLGAIFAYMIALPFMIQFLVTYNQSSLITSSISVASYIDFVMGMLVVFGIVFEMPMLAFVLSKLGILTPDIMRKIRSYVIPTFFLLAAIITPPDVASQFMVAIPMIGLYEMSILISIVVSRRRQLAEKEEEEEALQEQWFKEDVEDNEEAAEQEKSTSESRSEKHGEDDDDFWG